MDLVRHALYQNLEKKGMPQGMIPGFLRSLLNYVLTDPHMDHLEINHRLQIMGWNEIELDYHTFELAKTWMEAEGMDRRRYVQTR